MKDPSDTKSSSHTCMYPVSYTHLLQNCYPIKAYTEQKISVALALTDLLLEKLGKGICRIHGGGFAGVIMCVVPEEETENYVSYISEFAGKENVYPMNIRAVGAVHIEK